MARSEQVVWVQLATRIPRALHRKLKVHCVDTETSVMDFVASAIAEKLAGSTTTPPKGTKPYERTPR